MADNTASTQNTIDPADLRIGYQVAANLYMQENTVNWSRFNIMLTANTLLVSAVGLVSQSREPIALAASTPFLLSIVGVVT